VIRAIRIALRAVTRNVLRTSLTVLGILIGVAAVVIVTALGAGARDNVAAKIQGIGSNFIIIFPERAQVSGARGASGSGPRLTDDDGRAIAREAVSVAAVAPALRASAQVVYGDRNWSTSVVGSTLGFFPIRNWKVVHGAPWTESDEVLKAKVCILGSSVKDRLFGGEDPIGRTLRIGRYPYRVLGVLESKGEAPLGGDQDDMVLMPIGSMRARVVKTPPNFAGVLIMSATSAETTDRAVAQTDAILRQRHHFTPDAPAVDYRIQTLKQFQEMQGIVYNLLTVLLVGIAAISLVVGGIGVMNIMLVSVTERTREIGIRMAIGAREADIRTQFLVEAVVLAILGGIAGAALGYAVVAVAAKLTGWSMSPSPVALGVSIAVSGLTGVAFGFFPARRASRLDPIEALRHE
jgi:putative ABC transport system permease protein